MSFKIINIDCVEYIIDLKKKNGNIPIFDAIITDPPYNISRENNFKTINRNGINFGDWDSNFNQTLWINEVSSLVKPGGSIIIFNDYKNFGEICKVLENNDFLIKDLIRWIKNNPMPRNVKRRYVTDYEFAIWAVKKGKSWTFNVSSNLHYQRPEFKYSIVAKSKEKIHPTQKPLELMENLIRIHTNENDLIFDPFLGSGSTGIAALKLNRNFIGCEIDKTYFNKTKNRISKYDHNILLENQNNQIIRSPLYYLGDKYQLVNDLLNIFPKNINVFYDVFAGGGDFTCEYFFK